MTDYRELLIGCGRSREKRVAAPGTSFSKWRDLTTLDNNADVKPDWVIDLDRVSYNLPFDDDTFAEIHAYEVLEHLGAQGDAEKFFDLFYALWLALRAGGFLCATVPSRFSPWLWGDPGHRRVISKETLTFLDQTEYTRQCDSAHPTPMSDYRNLWKGDFEIIESTDNRHTHTFILKAVKPARIKL